MEQAPVNFKKVRDFGEIFNDTFSFIGQEFKPLSRVILIYALPWLIVAAILSVLVSIKQQEYINTVRSMTPEDITSNFGAVTGMYKYTFLTMMLYVIGICALQCTVISYIKLYVSKGKDQFAQEEIWAEAKKYIMPVLGMSIILSLLILVGMVLCLVPGIILTVSLSLILFAYIIEEKSFGDAFNRSFKLTGLNWWMTFGLIIVSYIMVYLIQLILSVPSILLGFKSLFSNFKNLQETGQLNFSVGFYIMNSITSLCYYILFSIMVIILAFQYYNLVESKERPSLQEKIDQIG
jgi:hypothetical protein